ncbi:hypothetical protein [Clavibacter sp. km1a]|uniref:hypothetical protein n=1 Tax=Clavibacter sp. km1a TaxID=3459136 RepID=UPI0040430027
MAADSILDALLDEASQELEASIPADLHVQEGQQLEGELADAYLSKVGSWVRDWTKSSVSELSPPAWLWILRRINPGRMGGSAEGSLLATLALAENLTQRHGDSGRNHLNRNHEVDYTVRVARATAILLAAANRLRLFDAYRRRVSKGQCLLGTPGAGFAGLKPDASLDAALLAHDKRLRNLEETWHPFLAFHIEEKFDPYAHVLTVGLDDDSTAAYLKPRNRIAAIDQAPSRWRFFCGALSDHAHDPTVAASGGSLPDAKYIAATYLVGQMTAQIVASHGHRFGAEDNGYIRISDRLLRIAFDVKLKYSRQERPSILTSYFPRTYHDLLKVLRAGPQELRAPIGLPLLKAKEFWIIDMFAIRLTLSRGFRIEKSGGKAVNTLGFAFEDDTQLSINNTLGRAPDMRYARYIGKTLFSNGNAVTDIDAMVQFDNQLVLVSCKAFEYTAAYDDGDYAAVRSARSRIADALTSWEQKLSFLSTNPIGSNYDLSGVALHGVVVTPSLLYSDHALAQQHVGPWSHIPRYLALPELLQALSRIPM